MYSLLFFAMKEKSKLFVHFLLLAYLSINSNCAVVSFLYTGTGGYFPGVNWSESNVDHGLPSSASVHPRM
jgi:hypothetical protein